MKPKNPIEKAVLSNVKVDYAAGSLSLTDPFTQLPVRVGIADLAFMIRLQNLLYTELAEKSADPGAFFYEFGKSWGMEFYDQLSERIKRAGIDSISQPQDFLKDEFIEHLNSYLSYSGMGQFRITEGNKFYIVNIKNSVEFSLDAPHSDYMNSTLCGFLAALFSSLAGREIFCSPLSGTKTPDRNRFALSTNQVIREITEHAASGKTEKEILALYGNQNLE